VIGGKKQITEVFAGISNLFMKKRTCAAFLFDGFSDGELALVMAALNRGGDYSLETFTSRGRTVTARSGIRVMPHTSLGNMRPEDFDVLLLPGGDQWEKGDNLEIFPLIKATFGRQLLIAVGSAILALADLGVLDAMPHTGCHPGYLKKHCPEYAGAAFFQQQPYISAGSVITIDSNMLMGSTNGILGLFDTLQEIYFNDHELHDPAC
jgi:putative intracellular protease/amidase